MNTPENVEAVQLTVKSPCTSICALDEDDVCVGCYRTADEICRWSRMSEPEKQEVVNLSRNRAKKNNPFV